MSDQHTRRTFVRTVALGTSAATVGAVGTLVGDETKKEPEKNEPRKPETEADARMDLIVARFGKHIDDSARKSVRGEIESIVHRAAALRKFPLDNGDGPFPVFTPYRAPIEIDRPAGRGGNAKERDGKG